MLEHHLKPTPAVTPSFDRMARAYVEAFRLAGAARLISNLETRVELRSTGDRWIPITINDCEATDTYVCSPYTTYTRQGCEQLRRLPSRGLRWPAAGLFSGMGRWLRGAAVDRVVHVNNWMLPTDLHDNLTIPYPGTLTRDLAAEFPDHFIAMRCLNHWSDATLMNELIQAGWVMLPSRQVWAINDLESDWAPRRDAAHDRSLTDKQLFVRDDFQQMSSADSHAIARLNEPLDLATCPQRKPVYTAAFMRITHAIGMIHFTGFRDCKDGSLVGVTGSFRAGDTLTVPIIGYDPQRPMPQSVYRVAVHALLEDACRLGLRIVLPSGAANFNRNRGARPYIEYTALYLAHLPKARQRPVLWLKAMLDHAVVPLMRKYEP